MKHAALPFAAAAAAAALAIACALTSAPPATAAPPKQKIITCPFLKEGHVTFDVPPKLGALPAAIDYDYPAKAGAFSGKMDAGFSEENATKSLRNSASETTTSFSSPWTRKSRRGSAS
jgi:hypothetical protein